LAIRKELTVEGLKKVTEVDFVNVSPWWLSWRRMGMTRYRGRGRYVRTTGQRAEVGIPDRRHISGSRHRIGSFSNIWWRSPAIRNYRFEAEGLRSNEAMFKGFCPEWAFLWEAGVRWLRSRVMELTGKKSRNESEKHG